MSRSYTAPTGKVYTGTDIAEHVLAHGQRTVFAAVALDGSGVWAIGDTEQEARAKACERRAWILMHADSADLDPLIPTDATFAAWLDTLAIVTLSGTTESLRVYVKALDDVIPWCPADLWDYIEPIKET